MGKTILVLLDACRYDAITEYAGYLEHLIDQGVGSKYRVQGALPSASRPIYETLLTGLPSLEHGITSNEIVRTSHCANLFRLCREQGLSTAAAAYRWISELYIRAPFRPESDRFCKNGDGWIQNGIFYYEDHYPDSHLFQDGEFLRTTCDPDFILYHSMNIDYQGHTAGGESPEYAAAVCFAVDCLARLLPVWMQGGYHVVITADHGMNRVGLHGGSTAEQRTVPLYLFSNAYKPGRFEETSISQLNIAPLLCRLLGIPAPDSMKTPLELLSV